MTNFFLFFFFVSPTGVLSDKVPSEGKDITVYIAVSLVAVIAIMIGIFVVYCRYV